MEGAAIKGFVKYLCAVAAVALAAPAGLRAQEPVQAQPPNFLERAVPFEPRPSTADGELLDVARAADVNLFVDATGLPEKASQAEVPAPGKQGWTLWGLITQLTTARRLAWDLQIQDQAFLIGAEPDLKQLRQKLLAGPGIEVAAPQLDEAAFSVRMLDYLRREQGWKGDATAWSKTIRIADLPADLKPEVLARGQRGILSGPGLDAMLSALRDETWQRSRLRILSPQEAEAGEPGLVLEMPTSTGFVRFKLILPQPQEHK